MWRFLIVLAVGLAALPWIAVKVMCRRADMESMDYRAWINYLADRSRKGPSRTDTLRMTNRRCYRWIGMGS